MLFWIVMLSIAIPILLLLAWEQAGKLALLPAPWNEEDWPDA